MVEQEIDLLEIGSALLKKWYLILLVMLIGGGIAFSISAFVLPELYTATTTMIVGKSEEVMKDQSSVEYYDILTNQKLVKTYSEIMKSRSVAEHVIENLALDVSAEELAKMLAVTSVQDTEIISLAVTNTIPERAKDIANEAAEVFQANVASYIKGADVHILDPALTPTDPSAPKTMKNIALGALAAFFMVVAAIVIRVMTDQSIKSQEHIESVLEIPVIGIIPLTYRESQR